MPFLLAVVRSGAPSTVSVLQLLEAILHAEGGPLEAANALANVRLRRPGTGEWVDFTRPDAAELDIERRWVREMKRAILSESLLFASCLADTSPDVRAAALGVLAAGFAGLLQEMPTLEPEIRQAPIDAAARMKLERILAAGTG
ncbi:hypothetical protein DB32_006460 [Sandaracinus amylolyticus]|uniref:Uncharacterized protein n=1 Tax=Sandaracinus amylolyticus TaxID=927083 RepID=A0A0F6W7D8_9BACT|nr:hypothetical protein DB32_006460 [Sandaracinus amylolyticus]